MSMKATTTPEWRAADLGALNGHSNARGVLDVLRVLSLGGEAGGVRLLSQKTIDLVFDVQADGVDLVLEAPFRCGIGYCLGSPRRAVRAGRARVLLGRLGWVAGRDGPRPPADDQLHDEQDGARHPRLRPRSEAYIRAVYAALELRPGIGAGVDLDDVVPNADHVTRQARVDRRPAGGGLGGAAPAEAVRAAGDPRAERRPRSLPVLLTGKWHGQLHDRTFLDVVPIPLLSSEPPTAVVFGGVLQAWRLTGGEEPPALDAEGCSVDRSRAG